MFKIILTLIFTSTIVFSSQVMISTKIVAKIIYALNSNAKIWIDKKDNYTDVINIDKLNIINNCTNADVLIVKNEKNLINECKNKPILVFDYDLLYTNTNSVAAFFWQKGRPNILFIKERLDKFNITIPSKYNSYLIEKL